MAIQRSAAYFGSIMLAVAGAASAQNPAPPSAPAPGGDHAQQYNVPPPPGYRSLPGRYVETEAERQEDELYVHDAEEWAAENCIAQKKDRATAGAVIGGLVGAIAGSGLAGRHDQAPSAILGAGAGAAAGSAIGKNTSPDCPPGYTMRSAPAPFYAPNFYPYTVYAAPAWYDPWVWYGGHWIYRPYPYHRFWYDRYWRHR